MKRLLQSIVVLFAISATVAAGAESGAVGTPLQIDPGQTTIEFSLGSLLHTVHGTFKLKRGNLRFDPGTGQASGELVVDAASGESGNKSRDNRMHKDILESGRYPDIIFRLDRVSGKVASQGESKGELHGMFSIHGAEHELTIPIEVTAADGVYHATGKFVVPYVEWGMKNPSTLFLRVSDKVELTFHTVAQP